MYLYMCAGRAFAGIHSRLQEQNTIKHDAHYALQRTVQNGAGEFLWLGYQRVYSLYKAFLFVILEPDVAQIRSDFSNFPIIR